MNLRIVIGLFSAFLLGSISHAAIPLMINHQGFVRVDGEPFAGTGEFKFGLYDADTALWVWTNDPDLQSGAFSIPPNAFLSLSVSDGHYSVILGDTNVAGMAAISSSAFDSDQVRLRIWFNDGTNGLELLGDERITSGAYAFHAVTADRADTAAIADEVVAGAVTSAMIANGAIGAGDIAAGAVTTSKLADSSVTTAKFDTNAVAPHAATADEASHATTADSADTAAIADEVVAGAVTSAMIADGAIASADLAGGAVTSAAISDGAIDSVDLATGAVATTNLADSAITTAKFDAGAVAPHALTSDSAGNGVPPGTIIAHAGPVTAGEGIVEPVAGWLWCNGTVVTTGAYPDLASVLSENWGDGSDADASTFNLPDLRGQFLRGVDKGQGIDPDADARTSEPGGGVLAGDRVGSYQLDATGKHKHKIEDVMKPSQTVGNDTFILVTGQTGTGGNWPRFRTDDGENPGNETRSKNAAVNYLIKY